jgi:hypothetical protein
LCHFGVPHNLLATKYLLSNHLFRFRFTSFFANFFFQSRSQVLSVVRRRGMYTPPALLIHSGDGGR